MNAWVLFYCFLIPNLLNHYSILTLKKNGVKYVSKKKVQKVFLFIIYNFIKKRIGIYLFIYLFCDQEKRYFSVWQRMGALTIRCHC